MSDNKPAHEPEPEESGRRGPLIAMIVVVALVVGGILLSQVLQRTGRIQDCVMQGRRNCAPVDATGH